MAAPKGNNYWQFRNKHGRGFKYDPELLWNEFIDYSEWIENTPLYETKVFPYKGEITQTQVPKMRAMGIESFCLFADIDMKTWGNYKQNEDFFHVTTRIEESIRRQKFEGASADLLNARIIARDLGLVEKSEQEHKFKAGNIKGITFDE